mgnify:CR=1 FL=1
MKLKWNPGAIDDQRAIVDYCKKQFGVIVSIEVREKIRRSAKLLKSHPQLGRVEPLLVGCTSLEYRSLVVDKVTKTSCLRQPCVAIRTLNRNRYGPANLLLNMENLKIWVNNCR